MISHLINPSQITFFFVNKDKRIFNIAMYTNFYYILLNKHLLLTKNTIRMNTKLKKIAGQQLQLLRLEKNLTQEQMSEKLNLSTSAYCKIEYGETDLTLTRLDKIAKVLGISALSLFSYIDKSMNPDTRQQLQKQQQQ